MKNIKKYINKKYFIYFIATLLISGLSFKLILHVKYKFRKHAFDKAMSRAKDSYIKDVETNKLDGITIKDSYKLIMVIEGEGDWVVSSDFLKACKNLGWQCKRFYKKLPADQEDLLDFNPDIILIMTHSFYPLDILRQLNPGVWHNSISFFYLSYSMREAFDQKTFKVRKTAPYKFDFIDGILVVDENYQILEQCKENFFSKNSQKNLDFLLFYPSRSKTVFKALDYKSIFYASVNVDPVRGGKKYSQLYSMLDRTPHFSAYGPAESWKSISNSYKGYVKDIDAEIQKHGIYLLLHGARHLNKEEDGIPTGRIFEAIANSAIIISDKNKFVIDNFGDNVFYIDQNASAKEMFNQINSHYKWIVAHPKEAEQKAKNCHEIFLKKFTNEIQLQNLAKMYEFIKQKKNSHFVSN